MEIGILKPNLELESLNLKSGFQNVPAIILALFTFFIERKSKKSFSFASSEQANHFRISKKPPIFRSIVELRVWDHIIRKLVIKPKKSYYLR